MKTSETRGIPVHEGNVPGSSLKQSPLCVISHFHRAVQMSNDELGPSGVLASKAPSSSNVNNLEWSHILKKRVVLLTEVRVCQLYSFLDAQPHLLPSGKDWSHFPMVFTNRYHGARLYMTVMLTMHPLLASTLPSSVELGGQALSGIYFLTDYVSPTQLLLKSKGFLSNCCLPHLPMLSFLLPQHLA